MADAGLPVEEEQQQEEQHEQHQAATAPDDVAGSGKQQDGTGLLLPLARIKKMMKEGGDVKQVSAEASYVVARAAELFLQELAERSHAALQADGHRKALDYKDVASTVQSWGALDFLTEVVPQKVKASDVSEQLQQQQQEHEPHVLNS